MSGTYAELPIEDIDAMLERLAAQEEPIRREALKIGAEALVSEAMVESPVLTGTLQASHTVFQADEDSAVIGVNTTYALPVHETHPTKSRWFISAVNRNFKRVMGGAIEVALGRAAGRAKA